MTQLADYQHKFKYIRFHREDGILEMTIHRDGGSALWDFGPTGIHRELGDAFHMIGRDPENKVIIFTGAGDVFITDFDWGDPNEPTDPMIRQALVDALPERSPYPLAAGLPELREAAARWCGTRFGVEVDPATEIVPTYGSKEAIFSLAEVLDTAGKVVGPKVEKSTNPAFERPALEAVRQWKFEAGTRRGEKVSFKMRVPITFSAS